MVGQAEIFTAAPNIPGVQVADAINALLSSGRIEIVGDVDDPRYRVRSKEDAIKLKGLNAEDILVYQVINQAGNTGIWTRDIKTRTNLPQAKISRTLKSLEERHLVKSVKSVQNANRKVYMLASLEPAKEITGGPWYGADQQPDKAFIDTIREVACEFVLKKGPVTVTEVAGFIMESGVSNQTLQDEDIENIMNTLGYDAALDRKDDGKYAKAERSTVISNPMTDAPCGGCPVFDKCKEGGPVSPATCVYYTQWLDSGVEGGHVDGSGVKEEDDDDDDANGDGV